MIKNAVIPDYVISKTDNEKHWISGRQLAQLYHLPRGSYWIFDGHESHETSLIRLTVRVDEDYREHFEKVKEDV